jgi:hypothetical protein
VNFDFTIHFWELVQQLLALIALSTFLWHVYKQVKRALDACLTILEQHKELYGWYVRVKDTIPGKT